MIKQESPTEWINDLTGDRGQDESFNIEATPEGMDIGGYTIPWAQIDAAREALRGNEDRTGLCTVREAVHTMRTYSKNPSDQMELCYKDGNEWINVELKITRVSEKHPSEYTESEPSLLQAMANFVNHIDPLSGPNIARRAAQMDNGDGTMTFRRDLPYGRK